MHRNIFRAFCDAWPLLMAAQGELRIAHCGGVHVGLDSLIKALNFVARLLGHPFRWRAPPNSKQQRKSLDSKLVPDPVCR